MKIVVVSHGALCTGLLDAFHMMSADESLVAVSLDDKGVDDFRQRLEHIVDTYLESGENIFIMSDLIGGTPYNESYALTLKYPERIRLVAGVNFPMLLETGLSCAGDPSLDELEATALAAGSQGIAAAQVAPVSTDNDEDLF